MIEDSRATWLAIDGHRLMLPAKLAHLVRQLRDQDEPRWTLGRLGASVPWLFPAQSPARPAVDVLFGVRLHRCGIDAHAGRNTARLEGLAAYRHPRMASPPGLKPAGVARKVSVSMPEDLTAAVQQRAGRGKFSQYVTEAVARQLELDLLAELSDQLTAEHGPVPETFLREAEAAWPDA